MSEVTTAPPATETPDHPPQRLVAVVVTIASLVVVSLLVLNTSRAAFSDRTENEGNTWATGAVSLTDSKDGTTMFEADGLVPGDIVTSDITVTNDSTVDLVDVRFFSEALSDPDGLAEHLNLTVEAEEVEIFTGTVAGFAAQHDVEGDADSWTDVAPDQARDYSFTVEFDPEASGEHLQVAEASLTFVWEATSKPVQTP